MIFWTFHGYFEVLKWHIISFKIDLLLVDPYVSCIDVMFLLSSPPPPPPSTFAFLITCFFYGTPYDSHRAIENDEVAFPKRC